MNAKRLAKRQKAQADRTKVAAYQAKHAEITHHDMPNRNVLEQSKPSYVKDRHAVGWKYADRPRPSKPRTHQRLSFKLDQTIVASTGVWYGQRVDGVTLIDGRIEGYVKYDGQRVPVVADRRSGTWTTQV